MRVAVYNARELLLGKKKKKNRTHFPLTAVDSPHPDTHLEQYSQSVRQGFICEIKNKRANAYDPTIEECSSRSSMRGAAAGVAAFQKGRKNVLTKI